MKLIILLFFVLALLVPLATSSSHHHKYRKCHKYLRSLIGDACGSECLGDLKLLQNIVCLGGKVSSEQVADVCCPEE
ncbi:hypothetical protein B9Z55_003214 [Caenorhabditis nigoni]|uniref:INSulin related n=1 Tax=Caenorhabditis nigoni TaxID=1611254 RepID=A0A2G5VP60_9PELO|nr:hypothetical protein B9Z55_003214 [Caenorhabditis nigoni]